MSSFAARSWHGRGAGEHCVLRDLDQYVGVDQSWGLDVAQVAAIQNVVTRLHAGGAAE
jgi:hypothetical protein